MNLILVFMMLPLGGACYSNITTLTTGNFGEWKTEQNGVNSACNNVSKDYYLNIKINGVDQTPRRRLVVWDSLRKNVDETTISSFEADIIKVRTGLKDLNKAIWQSKLNYAREFANATLIAQREIALKLINTTTTTGESIESKIIKLQQAGEQAKALINSEFEIAQAKILEAKKLALLNGEKPEDVAAIEAEANLHLTALNLTAQEQIIIIEQALNNSITEVINSDDGIRFCLSNGTNCMSSSGNLFNQVLNTTSNVTFNNVTANTGFFSFLGSLSSRITKLFVENIHINDTITFEGSDSTYTIRTTNDNDILRIFSGNNLDSSSKIKLYGINSSTNSGDVVIEAGNTSGSAVRLRTGVNNSNNRIVIQSDGDIILPDLNGTNNDYLCIASNGRLFRSNTAC